MALSAMRTCSLPMRAQDRPLSTPRHSHLPRRSHVALSTTSTLTEVKTVDVEVKTVDLEFQTKVRSVVLHLCGPWRSPLPD